MCATLIIEFRISVAHIDNNAVILTETSVFGTQHFCGLKTTSDIVTYVLLKKKKYRKVEILDVQNTAPTICDDLVVRALCHCYVYIILSGLYIKRFHTLFVSLYVPIAHYSVFDSMQLITAL